jgi:hypothetical protein
MALMDPHFFGPIGPQVPLEDRKGQWVEEGRQLYSQDDLVAQHPDLLNAFGFVDAYADK